jgi:phage major head subunit gpT-like protein
MIINDDLRAFTRIPQLFGVAAKRMESDAVYSLITANGAMSDTVALFHADHNNLGSAAALGSDGLSAGRTAMRTQKGLNGERIDATPAFLLAPVALETTADILLRSAALPTAEMSSGVVNPWAGKLTPVADPHLDDASETAWYLLAHPNQVPTIEVAYLEGEEQPYVEEMLDFNSDNLIVKVRHDFGAGVVDHVGAYKNPGQ